MSGTTQSQASNSSANSTTRPIQSVMSLPARSGEPGTVPAGSVYTTYHRYPAPGGGGGWLVYTINTKISPPRSDGRWITWVTSALDGKEVSGQSDVAALNTSAAEEKEAAMRDHVERRTIHCLDVPKQYWE